MEFPDLGDQCHERSCNRLDFLPMKCDACSQIFCKDHIQYRKHTCENAYQKDIQVPVCPLCNKPVPSKRSEPPDIAVGQHIDNDCMSDPAVNKRKIYTNRCSVKGCKQKELIPVRCTLCLNNYCLKHRHQADHDCQPVRGDRGSMSQAGAAAMARAQNSKKVHTEKKNSPSLLSKLNSHLTHPSMASATSRSNALTTYQNGMSEDEALAMAMQASLSETSTSGRPSLPRDVQEREDRLLAEAIAASQGQTIRLNKKKKKN